jgi:hypothetical protein
MDQGPLVEMRITEGKRLVDCLVEEGVPVTAACWLRDTEVEQWYLYLVTPLVTKKGATMNAYRRVNAVIRRLPEPLLLDPFEIKVVAPDSPVGKAVQEFHGRSPRPSPIHYREGRFGDVYIDGAYIYPPIAATVQ